MQNLEHLEQVALVRWFRLQHPALVLLAIPNGGQRHPAVAAKLKAEGALAGVSDLLLMTARGGKHGLWLELKAKGGRLSESQKAFQAKAEAEGYAVATCYGFDEARAVVEEYLIRG